MFPSLEQQLSAREKDILLAIAQGKASKQIAHELHISKHTVDTHRRNMIRKAKSANTTELIYRAIQEGWLKLC